MTNIYITPTWEGSDEYLLSLFGRDAAEMTVPELRELRDTINAMLPDEPELYMIERKNPGEGNEWLCDYRAKEGFTNAITALERVMYTYRSAGIRVYRDGKIIWEKALQ